ncbi:MAG: cell division protein ZipA [Pseudomonadota bacterium]|nr:cell division protein ZipA [Pseudomonadota bacterium]
MDTLRLTLLVIGLVIIAMIYAWGMRSRIRSRLAQRRRRALARHPENEPVLDKSGELAGEPETIPANEFGALPANDPFAHQRLVDVEIRPIRRTPPLVEPASGAVPAAGAVPDAGALTGDEPTPPPRPAPAPPARPAPTPEKPPARPAKPHGGADAAREPEMVVLLSVMAPSGQTFAGADILAAAQPLELQLGDHQVLDCLSDSDGQGKPVFSVGHLREPGTFDLSTIESLATPGLLLFMRLPGPVEGVAALDLMVATAGQLAQKLHGIVCDDRRNKMTNQALSHLRGEVAEFERRRRIRLQARV